MNSGTRHIHIIKWVILFGLTGLIDIIQILIDLTGVGIPVSTAAEPFIGVGLVIILQLMGINMLNRPKRWGSILAAFGLGAITGGIAPFWILDIWYIYRDVKKEEAEQRASQESADVTMAPLNKDGVREPQGTEKNRDQNLRPLVVDGVRRPNI